MAEQIDHPRKLHHRFEALCLEELGWCGTARTGKLRLTVRYKDRQVLEGVLVAPAM